MSAAHVLGSYVTHAKLPELGSGEIVANEKGVLRIRFASGERGFSADAAAPYLTTTQEAPAPTPAKKAAKKKSTKLAAKKDKAS